VSGLPDTWTEVPIGDVCAVVGGSTPRTSVAEYWDGDIPWVTPDDLAKDRSQYVATGRRCLTESGYASCSTQLLPPGTVLLTSRAPIGYVAIAKQEICTNQGFKSFVPPIGLSSKYLYWYLKWATPMIRDMGSGTTFSEISGKVAKTIPLRIPPTAEQERIVAAIEERFSRLDAGVVAVERALVGIDGWINSTVQTAFKGVAETTEAEETTLGDMCERVTKGTTPTSIGHRFTDEGINFVKVESIVDGRIIHSKCAHISEAAHADLERSQLQIDDVLVSIAGTLGRVGIVSEGDVPANTNQALAIVRLRDPLLSRFVMAWLGSPSIQSVLRGGGKGVGMGNLTLEQIRKLRVVLPTPGQRHLALERINDAKDAHARTVSGLAEQLARANRLRLSILLEAFSGKLVPQDPSDESSSRLLEHIAIERACISKPTSNRKPRTPFRKKTEQ